MKLRNSLVVFILVCLSFSCDLINLEQIKVHTYPDGEDTVVGATDLREPIWIDFSITPNKTSAEDLFMVTSFAGKQDGDFSWQENRLYFTPVPEWNRGRRYVLTFNGSLRAEDGRNFDVRCSVPFYGGEISNLPRLEDAQPASGSETSVDAALVFTFSEAMDQESFKREFSLSPNTDYDTDWNLDGTVVTLTPRDQWNNLTNYNWSLSDKCTDVDGTAVVQSYNGSFMTQEDSVPPGIQSITAAVPDWNTLFPDRADPALNSMFYRDAIKITFDEPVNYATVQDAFHIQPNVEGFVYEIVNGTDTYYVFLPLDGYVMDQKYHLSIDTTVEDLAGNKMQQQRDEWFTAGGIHPIAISSIEVAGLTITPDQFNSPDPVIFHIDPGEQRLLYSINFDSSAFSGFTEPDVQNAAAQAVTCSPITQGTLPVSKYSIQWPLPYNFKLNIGFSGFEESTTQKKQIYKLVIPGGAEGIVTQDGSRLPEDIIIYLQEDQP